MKLRIRSNTLRFRLGQDEVSDLCDRGYIEDAVRFGPAPEDAFIYRVESSDTVEHIGLRYQPGKIVVLLAESLCKGWPSSEDVGFKEDVSVGGGDGVSVMIEKDFVCLTPRDSREDEGAFPHPKGVGKRD